MQQQPSITSPPAFHIMIKPRGPICNLGCEYCYFLSKSKLYPESEFRMSEETLDRFTRQYIESQRVPEITFGWQGGEPTLMGLDFFKKVVELQKKYRKPGMKITNALQTNGTLLDEDWCHFLREESFLVGLSLDGPRQMHDAYRKDQGGKPTFDRVMAGLMLLKQNKVEFNILATVHAANAGNPLEVYRFFRDEAGVQFIQFIPIVELDNETGYQEGGRVTSRSVSARQYGEFLTTIFDEWIRVDVGKVFVQIFDVALGAWSNLPAGLCIFDQTCGTALVLEHNGDLYSCDHYVEPHYLLGNIENQDLVTLVGLEQQKRFGDAKRDGLPRYCRECEVRFICNGGCPKNRIRRTPDGEAGLNYLCKGYRAFFNHIDQPMKIMASLLQKGQPPARIMQVMSGEIPEQVLSQGSKKSSHRRRKR
jgi:uncharacterized protein